MSECKHKWSAEKYEEVPSRICHLCSEWELEIKLRRAEADRDAAQQQLQGQGAGLTALHLLLGNPENGLIEAVKKVIAERDEARANYQFMVDRAVDEKLDGYRELASKCAALEEERDRLLSDLEDAGLVTKDAVGHATASVQGLRELVATLLRPLKNYYHECRCRHPGIEQVNIEARLALQAAEKQGF